MQKNIHQQFELADYNDWKRQRNNSLEKKSYLTPEYYFFSIVIDAQSCTRLADILSTIASILNQSYRNIEILIINGEHLKLPSEIYSDCLNYRGLQSLSLKNKFDLFKPNTKECNARGDFIFFASAGTTWDSFAFALINFNLHMRSEIPDFIVSDSDELQEQVTFAQPIFATAGDENLFLSLLDTANIGFSSRFIKKNYKKNIEHPLQLYQQLQAEKIIIKISYIHENIVHYPDDYSLIKPNQPQEIDTRKLIGQRVSIIIPNKNGPKLLAQCLAMLNNHRDWELELIIVDNASQEGATWKYYDDLKKRFQAKIIIAPHKFNFARMVNMGVANSTGTVLVILNNDIEFTVEGQIDRLILEAIQAEIGIAGSLLLNQDQSINHAGILLNPAGFAGHVLRGASLVDTQVKKFISQKRYYAAVTGALIATRREVFDAVNGMDEVNLEVEFNDVDFCLKVRELGLKIVCLPLKGVIHRESSTRHLTPKQEGIKSRNKAYNLMLKRWPEYFRNDPYHHPHLIISESNQMILNHVE